MIVVTTENIAGYHISEVKGTAFGIIVRARGLGKDITAAFRTVVGGEIPEYTSLLEDARRQSIDRMVQNATAMGANAIIMFRFDSGSMGNNMSEVVAYGTAVVVKKI